MKATEKQKLFIKEIIAQIGGTFDFENGTKEEASQFISLHINDYHDLMSYLNTNWWGFEHQ